MLEQSLASGARSRVGALWLGGLALLGEGCANWQVIQPKDIPRIQTTWDQSRVSYGNGTVIELRKARVQYPMLHGEITELRDSEIPNPLPRVDVRIPTGIDLRLVHKIERMQPDPDRTALLITGLALGGAGVITGFVFLGIFFSRGGAVGPTF